MKLWQEIQRDTGEDLEIKVTGGLMLGESERDIEFLKGKIALEKSRGIEAELIGGNELRRDGAVHRRRRRLPPNGARARARSIRCAAPMR